MRSRVESELEPDLPNGACEVVVTTLDGIEHRATVLHAHGSIEAPLSDAELETKFRDNARIGASGCDVEAAIGALWELERATDVSALMHALTAR